MSEAARTLFEQYMSALGTQDARNPDDPSDQVFARGMARVTEFLSSTGSDAAVCLICLSHIKPSEAVWSCSSSCFAVLHLPCIQEWARNQVDACVMRQLDKIEDEEAHGEAPLTAAQARAAAEWGCPKCRQQYPASELPRTYTCFCGKEKIGNGHTAVPACGASLRAEAGKGACGKRRSKRRCGHQAYSCGRPCGKIQPCGHPCSAPCHPPGCCPPCEIVTERPCACGAEKRRVACCEGLFHCGKPCGRRLACGNHVCERVCHSGPCGECPHQGVRTCPCGKAVYPELKCTEKAPTCGATCGKLLPCGLHTCHDRCHHGECSSCRALVSKPCRCGKMMREVLCGAELLCDRRCTKLRSCTRHPCNMMRRSCVSIAGRPHEMKCHGSPPVSFQCACGQGQYSVPCGAESKVVAPRCNNPCPMPGLCRHAQQSGTVRHRCHYGPCPP
ncbi:hypothetical protein DUNSADRAFT_6781 [Dunaliella salina]|uniref:NF-X1-type domain-containing protein n=2 Tax=Dunaliella salina TaxID=3046 RepID=A0ABQ7H6R6_DUNSA|nr:hypothetical protein DUNSADRAFT_6781 [Dunaliella salina]|eukprot:KAF5842537.1 hypothetical protein DUNSADRAFT_6781 [Dunaliella salina]